MKLIQIPFHDLRKIEVEGHRTRDAHLMENFANSPKIQKLLILDRPTTWLEIVLKKKPKKIQHQKVLLKKNGFELVQIEDKIFAITYESKDFIGQILKKQKWFRYKFSDKSYVQFIKKSLDLLEMQDAHLISNNIFACDLLEKLDQKNKIFDAWDDFVKIENYTHIKDFIQDCYTTYARNANQWTTNAKKNKLSFEKQYAIQEIQVINNGVDENRFSTNLKAEIPEDMKKIPRPIYGFGGKITHLIDADLMNKVAEKNPDKHFVFVGQNMIPEILNQFNHHPNVHYLGDKHYDDYIHYLANFDVCLVPYVDDKKSSGANTIKVYEYLAMGKKVVGTRANGLEKLEDYLYAASSADEFSEFLNEEYANKSQGFDVQSNSWNGKVNAFIDLLK